MNQLLGYLLFRTNRQSEKDIASIGFKLFEKTLGNNNEFNIDEAIALKHNLTLSREQIRKIRHTLTNKGIYFPTTNELLEGRKQLRPPVESTLGTKGVKVSFHELVKMTTQSVLKIVSKEAKFESKENDKYIMHFKDGGDGAAQQPKLKSSKTITSKQNMFQYGLTPLKLVCTRDTGVKEIMWENRSPNSAMAVRPLYLIRELETDPELLEEVIKTTDQAREHLNNESIMLDLYSIKVDIYFFIQDTMKDLKFKRTISGLKGAKCILCNTKAEDWTSIERVMDGFPITHSAEESLQIYYDLVDDDGNIPRTRDDFHIRKGLTAKPITSSDQHSVTITHAYINGTGWFLKFLYRCHIDYRSWIEHSDPRGEPIRRSKERVLKHLEENHGLILDRCAAGGEKTGTSTTGNQGRRFFSEEVIETIEDLVPEKYKENLLLLHKQLSVILRVVSFSGQVDVDAFQQHCLDFSLNLIQNFPFVHLNDTLHATVHHSVELIMRNEGYGLGALSEEGLEANNNDIRNYLETFCRKTSPLEQLTDVMYRLLERSDPIVLQSISLQRTQKKCTECGSHEHTIRSHARKFTLPKGNYNTSVEAILL